MMIEDSKEWKQVDVSHPIILGCETSSATSNKRKRQQGNYSELFFGRLQTMLSFRAISRKPSHGALVKQPAFRGSTPEAGIDFRHGRKIEKLSTLNSNPIQSPHAGWRFRQTPGKVGARGARKQEWDAKNEKTKTRPASLFLGSGVVATMVSLIGVSHYLSSNSTTSLDAAMKVDAISLRASQIVDSNLMEEGKQENCCLEEPVTGIAFLPTFDSKSFVGCGVRKRYTFFNVYAVGFYFNAEDFKDIKDEEEFEAALLNPHRHRIIKIVINRNVTMQQVVDTLKESLEPRMKGQDLQSLEEFSKLRDAGKLQKGDEVILSIEGPHLDCKCSNGSSGQVHSEVFTRAVCDVYFGKDAVSPTAKASVLDRRMHFFP